MCIRITCGGLRSYRTKISILRDSDIVGRTLVYDFFKKTFTYITFPFPFFKKLCCCCCCFIFISNVQAELGTPELKLDGLAIQTLNFQMTENSVRIESSLH